MARKSARPMTPIFMACTSKIQKRLLAWIPREHFIWSTAGDDRRNGPDERGHNIFILCANGLVWRPKAMLYYSALPFCRTKRSCA